MTTDPQILDLLARWEELRKQGQLLSVEELCRQHPHLLAEVRNRLPTAEASTISGDDRPPDFEPAPPHPEANPVVPAGYRLVRRLGRGGFGEVWEATGPGGFAVALKYVFLHAKAGAIELRALEVIRNVRHPNLLTTFGTWEREDRLIIAMELADGTLGDLLLKAQRQGLPGLPREELHGYMRDAARAIDFLNAPRHSIDGRTGVSVQHRDIKPPNILLVGSGVKVGDFGLARVLEQTVASHTGSLTPAYAAPEFFEGKTAHSSDQYSLAVTYCQLRGGRTPFVGNLAQMTAGHLYRAPDLGMLPEEERPVVEHALAKDPNRRWPNCLAFVEALVAPPAYFPTAGPAATGEVRRLDGETRNVWALSFTPDGKLALAGGGERHLILWDLRTGRELRRLAGHTEPVRGVAIPASGEWGVSGSDDGSVRVWKLPGGEPIHRFPPGLGPVAGVAVSADGRWQLHGSANGKVRLWDQVKGEATLLKGHVGRVCAVALSPDGRLAAAAGGGHSVRDLGFKLGVVLDCAIRLWALPAVKVPRLLSGHTDLVQSVAFAADGRHLLSGSADGSVRLWQVQGEQEVACLRGHHGTVHQVVWADGRHALSAGADGTVRVWRLPDLSGDDPAADVGYELDCLTGHTDRVNGVAVSPDGQFALSSSADGTTRLWRLALA